MKILILGAKGRFGRHSVEAALAQNHEVIALARTWDDATTIPGLARATGDAHDPEAIAAAGTGADVVLNALNPPYEAWQKSLIPLTQSVLAACQTLNLPLLSLGNLYAYGPAMPARIGPDTPKAPSNALATVRYACDQLIGRASVPTLLLRGGDFLEGTQTGNWFDTHMTQGLANGRFAYPGPTGLDHSFAYLPDMARAAIDLCQGLRAQTGHREVLFPGYTLTGQDLCRRTAHAMGWDLTLRGFPWPLMRLLSLVSPRLRGVVAMSYLWRTPHAVAGEDFDQLLPDFQPTPVEEAFAAMLQDRRNPNQG